MPTRLSWTFLCTFLVAFTTSQVASATEWLIKDASPHERTMNLDFVGTLYPGWVGASGWVDIPIVPNGFIPALNDSFDIEAGAYVDYFWYYSAGNYVGLTPMGGVRWQFHLTPDWSVFALAKAGFRIPFGDYTGGVEFDTGVGAYWHFSKDMSLRLEAANRGFGVGISLNL